MTTTVVTFELTDTHYVSGGQVRPGEVVMVQSHYIGIVIGFAGDLIVVFVNDASIVERSSVWRMAMAVIDEDGNEL